MVPTARKMETSDNRKVRMDESVEEPATTSRKTKVHQPPQKEDTRRITLVNIKQNVSGVLLSKVGPSTNSSIYSEDIRQIINCVFEVDKTAMILPHNNNPVQALSRNQFDTMDEADFARFFDIKIEQWGHKREDTWRTVMSFYFASDIIESDLKQLRRHSGTETMLQDLSFRMSTHSLQESSDEAVGFLLGKSQQYTWRDEIVVRVQKHLQESQAANQKETTDPPLTPTPIPLVAKLRTIHDSENSAEVITLFTGKKYAKKVLELLEQHPFQDIDIVPYAMKRSHPLEWTQRLRIHNIQVNDSRAVKVHRVNDSVREALARNLRVDREARTRVLDLARLKSTSSTNTLYVQCNKLDKQWVTTWISTQLPVISNQLDLDEDQIPYIEDETMSPGSNATRTRDSNTPTNPPPPTRFQHILQDPRYTPANSDGASVSRRKSGRVPRAIITGSRPISGSVPRSYAKVTTSVPGESNSQSTFSSPDRSNTSTIKTQRETELEEELSATNSQLKETQQKLTEATEQLKTTQEAHDKLKSLLEESVNNIQTQLQVQRAEMEESMNRRLAEQWQLFQSQIAVQNMNPMTTPNHPRKRQDTRHTPFETYGMPHQASMHPPSYPMQYFYDQHQHYNMNHPSPYRTTEDYHPTSPIYSPGQMEQAQDHEWSATTDQLQETSMEDVSAAQR